MCLLWPVFKENSGNVAKHLASSYYAHQEKRGQETSKGKGVCHSNPQPNQHFGAISSEHLNHLSHYTASAPGGQSENCVLALQTVLHEKNATQAQSSFGKETQWHVSITDVTLLM